MKKQELIQFEKETKVLFLDAKIRAPVHLSGGNEEPLIEIFKQIRKSEESTSEYWLINNIP